MLCGMTTAGYAINCPYGQLFRKREPESPLAFISSEVSYGGRGSLLVIGIVIVF